MKGKSLIPHATLAGGIVVFANSYPSVALANGADASILIPKPAEFIPALIAFLVIWFVLAKYLWPIVLKNLDAREKYIQENLSQAEAKRLESEEVLKECHAKIEEAHRKADEIIAKAQHDAQSERSLIRAQATQEASDIIERAREAVDNAKESAKLELVGQVANLSVDIASKILIEKLDVAQQMELIDKYLEEVGNFNAK